MFPRHLKVWAPTVICLQIVHVWLQFHSTCHCVSLHWLYCSIGLTCTKLFTSSWSVSSILLGIFEIKNLYDYFKNPLTWFWLTNSVYDFVKMRNCLFCKFLCQYVFVISRNAGFKIARSFWDYYPHNGDTLYLMNYLEIYNDWEVHDLPHHASLEVIALSHSGMARLSWLG